MDKRKEERKKEKRNKIEGEDILFHHE